MNICNVNKRTLTPAAHLEKEGKGFEVRRRRLAWYTARRPTSQASERETSGITYCTVLQCGTDQKQERAITAQRSIWQVVDRPFYCCISERLRNDALEAATTRSPEKVGLGQLDELDSVPAKHGLESE